MSDLQAVVEASIGKFPGVTIRTMFGCPALWAQGEVFALVWKTGRIGLKLPDRTSYETLLGLPGAEPWAPGGKKMGGWVLVPEGLHEEPRQFAAWAVRAHNLAVLAAWEADAPAAARARSPAKAARKTGAANTVAARKGAAKKGAARKGAAKKGAARKGAAQKGAAQKGAAQKSTVQKGAAKKPAVKKSAVKNGAKRRR